METFPSSPGASGTIPSGSIRLTWKTALLTALKGRSRRDFFRAAFVATPATVIGSFEKGIGTGLLLGLWVGVGILVIDIVDTALKSRKRARKEASRVSD